MLGEVTNRAGRIKADGTEGPEEPSAGHLARRGTGREYLHASHRWYFGGHSSSQLARLHMHTR